MGMVGAVIGPLRITPECCAADAVRNSLAFASGAVVAWQHLPTDALGECSLILQNVVIGSRYRVEIASGGTTVADGIAAGSTVVLAVPYYSIGNGNNTLRVKVRNAGAPAYRAFETQATAAAGEVLVFVSQELDE